MIPNPVALVFSQYQPGAEGWLAESECAKRPGDVQVRVAADRMNWMNRMNAAIAA
jgi:hypothetical protein